MKIELIFKNERYQYGVLKIDDTSSYNQVKQDTKSVYGLQASTLPNT